jgi:hypothetical protein
MPTFFQFDTDNGALNAAEAWTLLTSRSDIDFGLLTESAALIVDRLEIDTGAINSSESIVFSRANTDVGFIAAGESLLKDLSDIDSSLIGSQETDTLKTAKAFFDADPAMLSSAETESKQVFFIQNIAEIDSASFSTTEAEGIQKVKVSPPASIRVSNYLRRTA